MFLSIFKIVASEQVLVYEHSRSYNILVILKQTY